METVVKNINESIDALHNMQLLFAKRPGLERIIICFSTTVEDGDVIQDVLRITANEIITTAEEVDDWASIEQILGYAIDNHPTYPLFKEDISIIEDIFSKVAWLVDEEHDYMTFIRSEVLRLNFKLYMR